MSVIESNNEGLQVNSKIEEWAGDPVLKDVPPEIQRAFIRFLTKHAENPFGLNMREVLGNSIYPLPLDRKDGRPKQITILDIFADGWRAAMASLEKPPVSETDS